AEQSAASHTVKSAELGESLATVASPIDGVVLRGPDPTAAGDREPLFVLGTGLDKLRLDAEVAESEIGLVQVAQRAEFTVPAHPAPFEARVESLGIDARRTGLSVRYPVELRLDNPKGLLLPGMTATVRIEVARVEGALATREAALRFRPETSEELPPRSHVFALRGSTLAPLPVTAGLSDGAYTELAAGSSPEIAPGTLLAVGVRTGAEKKRGAGLSLGGK
ncbi:MAG: HlyD family efflux transporter periplasmic adaptor subunit, partial [Deltaproteobacteria bacterium]|nr:HlyD family efflux transporter periplasmic adaptor subunit [Deltaproteobacteria bacterium]